MLGFIVGTICLIALIAVLRRRRWHRGHYHRYGWGPRAWLWRTSRYLGATPQQEKLFRDELVAFLDEARGLGGALQQARTELASALRDERLDSGRIDAVLTKQQELITGLRTRLVASLGSIHQTLDAEQRRRVAEIVESGPRRAYAGGC
jgi:hypothetical protein